MKVTVTLALPRRSFLAALATPLILRHPSMGRLVPVTGLVRRIYWRDGVNAIQLDLSPGAVNYANLAGFLLPPLCTPDRKWFSLAADAPA